MEPRGDCVLAVKGGKPQPIFELKIDLETWKLLGLGSRMIIPLCKVHGEH